MTGAASVELNQWIFLQFLHYQDQIIFFAPIYYSLDFAVQTDSYAEFEAILYCMKLLLKADVEFLHKQLFKIKFKDFWICRIQQIVSWISVRLPACHPCNVCTLFFYFFGTEGVFCWCWIWTRWIGSIPWLDLKLLGERTNLQVWFVCAWWTYLQNDFNKDCDATVFPWIPSKFWIKIFMLDSNSINNKYVIINYRCHSSQACFTVILVDYRSRTL